MRATRPIACLFTLITLLFLFRPSRPLSTIVVDGLAEWKAPTTLHVGDSLVFKHKRLQNLYLFHNRRAFDLCNFAHATITYESNSTHVTWSPSRPGYYYFSTRDKCEKGEKVLVRVITPDLSPGFPPVSAPPPTSGGDISSSPSHSWGWVSSSPSSPSPAPETSPLEPREGTPSTASPSAAPENGSGIPFISSNPAVPLPTGVTDTATIRQLPAPGDGNQVVGLGSSLPIKMALLASVMISSALGLWLCDDLCRFEAFYVTWSMLYTSLFSPHPVCSFHLNLFLYSVTCDWDITMPCYKRVQENSKMQPANPL